MDLPRSHKDTEIVKDPPQRHEDTEMITINQLTHQIIGCAIEVHRVLGPGLLEPMYETAICVEMEDVGLRCERQVLVPAYYKEHIIGEYRIDLIVNDLVVVEIKSVERPNPVFEAQVLSYLRITGRRVGLLINFNTRLVREGIKRLIL